VKGDWKLRPPHLKALRDRCQAAMRTFNAFDIEWVPREQNPQADRLAGELLAPLRPRPTTKDVVELP
jgi:ribonuclease HI